MCLRLKLWLRDRAVKDRRHCINGRLRLSKGLGLSLRLCLGLCLEGDLCWAGQVLLLLPLYLQHMLHLRLISGHLLQLLVLD